MINGLGPYLNRLLRSQKLFLKLNKSFYSYLANFVQRAYDFKKKKNKKLTIKARKILLLVEALFWFMFEFISYLIELL